MAIWQDEDCNVKLDSEADLEVFANAGGWDGVAGICEDLGYEVDELLGCWMTICRSRVHDVGEPTGEVIEVKDGDIG
jgi:hypothetical protein